MNPVIAQIQTILNDNGFPCGSADGIAGPRTTAAWLALCEADNQARMAAQSSVDGAGGGYEDKTVHRGMASSFADPADVAAFRHCKASGGSDVECFRVGDNGIGLWQDDTTAPTPMVALPPEDWEPFGPAARGKKVLVSCNGREVVCELRDTMPHKAKIKNGAIIDCNYEAVQAFGLSPPILTPCAWQWA